MAEESKQVDPVKEQLAADASDAAAAASSAQQPPPHAVDSDDESGSDDEAPAAQDNDGTAAAKKKKKNKKKKGKAKQVLSDALGGAQAALHAHSDPKKAIDGLSPEQINEFIQLNPALANELLGSSGSSVDTQSAIEAFKQLKIQDIVTGLASSGKNRKDMASYKFWATQPVPQFDEDKPKLIEEGPVRTQKIEDVPTEPVPLIIDQFRWVTMDLTDPAQMEEVEKLLYGHYVEDDEAMFRFKYSKSILKW